MKFEFIRQARKSQRRAKAEAMKTAKAAAKAALKVINRPDRPPIDNSHVNGKAA